MFHFKVTLKVEVCEEAKWCSLCVVKHEVVHVACCCHFTAVSPL